MGGYVRDHWSHATGGWVCERSGCQGKVGWVCARPVRGVRARVGGYVRDQESQGKGGWVCERPGVSG